MFGNYYSNRPKQLPKQMEQFERLAQPVASFENAKAIARHPFE